MYLLIIIFLAIIFGSLGQLAFKSAMVGIGKVDKLLDALNPSRLYDIFTNKFILLGLFLYFISTSFYLVVLSNTDLSYAYPLVVGLSFVSVSILAMVIFGENISLLRWLGIILIIAGGYFIGRS